MNSDPHNFWVSSGTKPADLSWTLSRLQKTYFGKTRTMDELVEQCRNSICFSLMRRDYAADGFDSQVGFCRVVTDRVSFGWLSDFLIEEESRGKGLGYFLMDSVLRHHEIKKLTMNLVTRDSHGFYSKFKFTEAAHMIRRPLNE